MHDVWEPTLMKKIMAFLERKALTYPDLELLAKWDEFEYSPRRKHDTRSKASVTLKEDLQKLWS